LESVGILSFDIVFIQEVIFNWIAVGVMAFILYMLMYKPVTKFMQNRKERISLQLTEAGNKFDEASKMKAEYEEKLLNVQKEKAEILESARKEGDDSRTRIVEAARDEADKIRERALLDIERFTARAQDEMKSQLIEISSLMASRIVRVSMNEDEADRLVEAAITDLGDVKWSG
jgi:F-type H+-transporting ATPase subunit b